MAQSDQEKVSGSWMEYMMQGNFEAAWKISDADLESRKGIPCWHLPRHFQYIWDGSPLDRKRVLVRCYHGLGDTIQFIRYMPLVKAIAAETIVWAQERLIPLLQTAEGIDQIIPLHDGTPEVAYDVDVELMELPHIFRSTLETIPKKIPYLHVDRHQGFAGNGKLAVGLVWRSGDWDENRSIPFHLLSPLKEVSGVQFYLLQSNPESAGWDRSLGVQACQKSLLEDARVIKSLDLMISVDTMTAHLAGALGVPVWNLLQANADWRWMKQRTDSPWYPTMRLFRQDQMGNWEGVIKRVVTALNDWQKNKPDTLSSS